LPSDHTTENYFKTFTNKNFVQSKHNIFDNVKFATSFGYK